MSENNRAGILFVGSYFEGNTLQYSEALSRKLAGAGYRVLTVSRKKARLARLLDILFSVFSKRKLYDAVHCDVFSGRGFIQAELAARAAKLMKKKVVVTLHGGRLSDFAARNPKRVGMLLRSSDVVTSPSKELGEQLRSFRDDIAHIPDAVEISDFHFQKRERAAPNMVWLRAFHEYYDPVMAVKVLGRVVEEYPSARLLMAGRRKDKSYEEVLAAVDERGLGENVRIEGQVPGEDVPRFLGRGDIFLNTTKFESFGISLIEAAASGMCIVTTDSGELPHIWKNGVDAMICPSGDWEAMAAAVIQILKAPELAERLSANARKKAENYRWENIMGEWERLFEGLFP